MLMNKCKKVCDVISKERERLRNLVFLLLIRPLTPMCGIRGSILIFCKKRADTRVCPYKCIISSILLYCVTGGCGA